MPWDRIRRYGKATGYLAENIAYGSNEAIDIVMSLFVDDGEPERGHRWNMMATEYNKTAVAFCKHENPKIKYMADMLYATKFDVNTLGMIRIDQLNKNRRSKSL